MNIAWDKLGGLLPAIVINETGKVIMHAYMNEEALALSLSTGLAHYYSRSRAKLWQKGESSGHIQRIQAIWLDCDADTLLLQVAQEGVACHTGRKGCFYRGVDAFSASAHELVDKFKNGKLSAAELIKGVKCADDESFFIASSPCEQSLTPKPDSKPSMLVKPHYDVLDELYHAVLERRLSGDAKSSYVASLFAKGHEAMLKKVAEEAGEFIMACKEAEFARRLGQDINEPNAATVPQSQDKAIKPNIAKSAKEAVIYEAADMIFHTIVALCALDTHPQAVLDELSRRFGISGIEEKNSRAK
ncbi:phosphoribosyl-AMP cyclohydrolase [Campylobacter sp. 19-13652]|uniref:phosphoribosyl-AMP cyclohydrolase n=1 Tax=Campylobacter sp. 19-13652 TaxID=2840180 RepID=UPI001C780260|nr:phosphoribosyl-AMP cyclohydrolase [Campylobacter sp. 19-13652]BCX78577.1 histidine biosynthesis bifunctional protein HisIE [Campylobacter sp. 19-13652]